MRSHHELNWFVATSPETENSDVQVLGEDRTRYRFGCCAAATRVSLASHSIA
jgi:hypothetical protein